MPKASAGEISKARKVVYARDGHQCQLCGRSVVDFPSNVHHRMNKGNGGSALLERPSLLVRLCGSGATFCHGWVTEHPKLAYLTGWLLPRNNPDIDPTTEPILIYGGRWVLLDDGGGVTPCEAPQEVPA